MLADKIKSEISIVMPIVTFLVGIFVGYISPNDQRGPPKEIAIIQEEKIERLYTRWGTGTGYTAEIYYHNPNEPALFFRNSEKLYLPLRDIKEVKKKELERKLDDIYQGGIKFEGDKNEKF